MGLTDYLEEHLGSAEALLERIRQLERSELSGGTVVRESVKKSDDFSVKMRDKAKKSDIVSDKEEEVYDMDTDINQIEKSVDISESDLEIHRKEPDTDVNHRKKTGDNSQTREQAETASRAEETGTQTNAKRAEHRAPLSDQLEELDRAVSALTTLIPAERESSGYPVSLSPPRGPAADPSVTGVTGGGWSGPDTSSGAGLAYDGMPNWAEQADRMFRRDSRRYDGGFYLY